MIIKNDWERFRKTEDTAIIRFLMGSASALAEMGAITTQDCNNLRINFRDLHFSTNSVDSTLIDTLLKDHNEFLRILSNRYGSMGLHLNLLRFTATAQLQRLNALLADYGSKFIEKSNMFFNRTVYIHSASSCERRVLFSGMITQLVQVLADASQMIEDLIKQLALFHPTDLALSSSIDRDIDSAMLKHLNLEAIHRDYIPLCVENSIKFKFTSCCLSLLAQFQEFVWQFRRNNSGGNHTQLPPIGEWLRAEITKMQNAELCKAEDGENLEQSRRIFCSAIYAIGEGIEHLLNETLSLIMPANLLQEDFIFSADMKRQIVSELVLKGLAITVAESASNAFVSYCDNQKIKPGEVIVGELCKIHPQLTPASLLLFQSIQEDIKVATKQPHEKESLYAKNRQLGEFFQRLATSLSLVLLIMTLTLGSVSCGVKTFVKSDLEDFRPMITFHPAGRTKQLPGSQQPDIIPKSSGENK